MGRLKAQREIESGARIKNTIDLKHYRNAVYE